MGIRNNLIEAIWAVERQDESLLSLSTWAQKTPNGMSYCIAGLLSQDMFFADQGMQLGFSNNGYIVTNRLYGNAPITVIEGWTDRMFGLNAYSRIFTRRGRGNLDMQFLTHYGNHISDKQLALARLNTQLHHYKEQYNGN